MKIDEVRRLTPDQLSEQLISLKKDAKSGTYIITGFGNA